MYTPAQAREFAEDMGSFPFMDAEEVLRSLADQVEALEAQLAAVGAGGVQRLTLCTHEWVDARNAVVKSGELCSKCGAMRAGNVDAATKETPRPTKYWAYVKDGVSDVFDMPPLPAGTRFTAIPVKDEFGNKFALIDLTNSAPPQYWIYTAQEKISDIQAQVL